MNSTFQFSILGFTAMRSRAKKKTSGSLGLVGFSCCKQAMVRGKQNVRAACWGGDDQINNGKNIPKILRIRSGFIKYDLLPKGVASVLFCCCCYCCSLGVWSSTKRREKDYYCHQYRRNQVSKAQGTRLTFIKANSQQFKLKEKVLISRW